MQIEPDLWKVIDREEIEKKALGYIDRDKFLEIIKKAPRPKFPLEKGEVEEFICMDSLNSIIEELELKSKDLTKKKNDLSKQRNELTNEVSNFEIQRQDYEFKKERVYDKILRGV